MDKKYTSLEHAIRNIVKESIGISGKDKPEGTPRSFLKPVGVISPPKGEEHPGTKKTATILAQRGEDKVQHGLKSEENIEEQTKKKEEEEGESWDPASETTTKKKSDKDKVVGGNLPAGMKPTGEITSREPLPTEKLSSAIEKIYGGGKEARERVEKIGKAASALTFGATDIAGSYMDARELAKRGEGLKAAKEFATGVALPLAGGALLGRFGNKVLKQADQAKMLPKPETAPKVEVPKAETAPKVEVPKTETPTAEIKPPADKSKATYQPFAQQRTINARQTGARVSISAREPSSSASTKLRRHDDRLGVSPAPAAPAAPPTGPRGPTGPKAEKKPETLSDVSGVNVVPMPKGDGGTSMKLGGDQPSVVQLKPTGAAVPKIEPPTPKPSGPPQRAPIRREKGPDRRNVPWRPAPSKPQREVETPPHVTPAPKIPEPVTPPAPKRDTPPDVVPYRVTKPAAAPQTVATPGQQTAAVTKPVGQTAVSPSADVAAQPALAKQTAVNAAAAKASENLANQNKKKEQNRKKEEKQQNRKRMPFSLSIPGINPQTISGLQGNVPSKPYLHYAQDYVNFGESNDADNVRRYIENVARPGGKTRVTKQAEIKQKIIDENVKRANIVRKVIADKKDSTVILKPKLKHPELDEN
jgi:hypothetical protein